MGLLVFKLICGLFLLVIRFLQNGELLKETLLFSWPTKFIFCGCSCANRQKIGTLVLDVFIAVY